MTDIESAKFAAKVAVEILARADDGTKLLAIHKYYPKGLAAFSVGFCFVWGGVTAIGLMASIGFAISRITQ